jgi:hypothetical protein
MKKTIFIALVAGAFGSASAAETPREATMKEARHAAAHRTRRIIMNNDGNDVFLSEAAGTPEGFLSQRCTPLVGSQVDALFYCTGVFNLYSHRSDVSELLTQGDQGVKSYARELIEQGRDTLELVLDFGHAHGLEVFWSMRMNDTHDSADPTLLCQWKKDHPEGLMGRPGDPFPYGGNRWSAVNYARPEVREQVFRIFQDVCTRYEVDGLEMDFFRHPVFFLPQMTGEPVTQEHCDLMTDLLRRVREMTEKVAQQRGRPLLISVRVPDSVGCAKAIGLDLIRWLEDDLIDLLVGGCYFHLEPWENLVALGQRYDVPVYAGLSASRLPDPIEVWRGEAMRAWKAGVSGIYTFNRFDPRDPLFRELGSPETLQGRPMTYQFNPGWNEINYWLKDGERFVVPEETTP